MAVTFIGEKVGEAQDGIERCAQFVAHRGEKLILELAAALGFFFGMQQGSLCLSAVSDVAQYARKKYIFLSFPARQREFERKLGTILSLTGQFHRLADDPRFAGLQEEV